MAGGGDSVLIVVHEGAAFRSFRRSLDPRVLILAFAEARAVVDTKNSRIARKLDIHDDQSRSCAVNSAADKRIVDLTAL